MLTAAVELVWLLGLVRERGVWSAQATRDADVLRKCVREFGYDPVQAFLDTAR